jgi:DsbC/DsbD-like thiol-disulfide interchange protein
MIAPGLRRRIVLPVVVAAVFALFIGVPRSPAADMSAWAGGARSSLRLIAGTPASGQGFLRAGIEIKLAPGWKTYWRYPGDSGVMPRFDFAGSTNMQSVAVDWPAPHAWRDAGGASIGYKEKVILPLRIVAQNPAQPVRLALAFDYAICERVCVPESGSAELRLPSTAPDEDAALAAAEAQVPKQGAVGTGEGVVIRAVAREGEWPRPRVVVDVAAPAGASVHLFAEGPTADWALPVPEPAGEARDGLHRFAFTLDGVPPGIDPKGATLRLTAVAGKEGIEAPYRLD